MRGQGYIVEALHKLPVKILIRLPTGARWSTNNGRSQPTPSGYLRVVGECVNALNALPKVTLCAS